MPHPPSDSTDAAILVPLRNALAGRYEVHERIGQGGMGRVYRARDTRHARDVAVKVLPPDIATVIASGRFAREIRTAATLLHPHILGLIDSGHAEGLAYYIMPYVAGESLRRRIERAAPLPVAEAVRIALEIASALEHAHAHDIVHRDIKPENILLADDTHVLVADFGLARMIDPVREVRLTLSGNVVGTVTYLSPEQAGGAAPDGRADIYSLGCVLFEMLTGHPPFTGDTVMAVLAQHLSAPPPPLSTADAPFPVELERVVHRALEKRPDERYGTAAEFASDLAAAMAAIAGHEGSSGRRPLALGRRRRGRRTAASLSTLLLIALGAAGSYATDVPSSVHAWIGGLARPALDTTRFVVFPLRDGSNALVASDEGALLHDAFARWTGISVADHFQVRDALDRLGRAPGADELQSVAAGLGAGRYVHAELRGRRLRVGVYDTRRGQRLADTSLMIDTTGDDEPAVYAAVAGSLLFRDVTSRVREASARGTSSIEAARAFARGSRAVDQWNLVEADSAFAAAIAHDRDFGAAYLWLAQVRGWASHTPAEWQVLAQNAVTHEDQLHPRDRKLARALLHMASDSFPQACALYREVKAATPNDFSATFGLGECMSRDDFVVHDPRSPSGWRFRADRNAALDAYREAFAITPSIHKAFRDRSFDRLRRIFLTSTATRITGRALPPDTTTFRAAPALIGGKLALVPWPVTTDVRDPERTLTTTASEAIDRQRMMFLEVATGWRRHFPRDALAAEIVAIALELGGDPRALDTLQAARRLPADDTLRLRLAVHEVFLRAKLGIPDDLGSLDRARALADSLLRAHPEATGRRAEALVPVALLVGRVHMAAALAQRAAVRDHGYDAVPPRTLAASEALVAYAAAGGPVDSIRALEARVAADVGVMLQRERRREALALLLGRAAALAFPVQPFANAGALAGAGNHVLDAQWSLASGDAAGAKATLSRLGRVRAARRPADYTMDISYPGAWTLMAAGDVDGALGWIGPGLDALSMHPPEIITQPANTGALMQALALRAELAMMRRDATGAARWARPVTVLWRRADAPLRPVVARMEAFAAGADRRRLGN